MVRRKADMSSIRPEQKNDLRATVLELANACLFQQANPNDCPLFPVRIMKPAKRLKWVNALSKDDLLYLANYHQVCFSIKGAFRSPGQ